MEGPWLAHMQLVQSNGEGISTKKFVIQEDHARIPCPALLRRVKSPSRKRPASRELFLRKTILDARQILRPKENTDQRWDSIESSPGRTGDSLPRPVQRTQNSPLYFRERVKTNHFMGKLVVTTLPFLERQELYEYEYEHEYAGQSTRIAGSLSKQPIPLVRVVR